jgi:hypothetical protein
MGQVLHRGATTTEAIRRAIHHSQESLFGGGGFDADGNSGLLNDLREFSPSALLWTWMGGSNTVGNQAGQLGVYGTLGKPAPENIPRGRAGAVASVDKAGQVWLFGGDGIVQPYDAGAYNDLWEYDPSSNQWTWMGGNTSACDYGVQSGVWGSTSLQNVCQ